MARQTMVTRTVCTSNIKVWSANLDTNEITADIITLPNDLSNLDRKKLLKYINKTLDADYINAQFIDLNEKLYGMTLETFIANSKELPPRTQTDTDTENN